MTNPTGTFPADLTGLSESANAPALTSNTGVNAMNPRLAACEWTANKNQPGGYIGQDTNSNATLAGTFSANGIVVNANIGSSQTYAAFFTKNGGSPVLEARDPGAASANYAYTTASVAGSPVIIGSDGSDAAIGLTLTTKGGADVTSTSKTSIDNAAGSHTGFGTYNLGINAPAGSDAVFCLNIQGQTALYIALETGTSQLSIGGYGWGPRKWTLDSSGNTVQAGGVTFGANIASTSGYIAAFTVNGGSPAFEMRDTGAASTNYPFVRAGSPVTGGDVAIGVDGSDANVNVDISAKGTGSINVSSPLVASAGTKLTNLSASPGAAGSGTLFDNGGLVALSKATLPNPLFQVAGATNPLDLLSLLGGAVVPEMFGVNVGTGGDDTAAFNAMIASGAKNIIIPAKSYHITGIALANSGTKLSGCGVGSKIIVTSATAVGISVPAGLTGIVLQNFEISRSVSPSANANGIAFATTGNARVENLHVLGHYNGIVLTDTDLSYAEYNLFEQNTNHGILITNGAAGTPQWILTKNTSQKNGGHGYAVISTNGLGATQITVGLWDGNSSFANSGCGAAFVGSAGVPIQGVRLIGGFYGQDGSDEIHLDTYGGQISIDGVFIELAGTIATGPTLSTAKTNLGHGITASANTHDVSITGGRITGCSQNGILTQASGLTSITGGTRINGNGQAGDTANAAGINANGSRLLVSGIACGNAGDGLPIGNTQQYAITGGSALDGSGIVIVGNDFFGNAASALNLGATPNITSATVLGNTPAATLMILPAGNGLGFGVAPAGAGTINTAAGIYKAGTAYNNP